MERKEGGDAINRELIRTHALAAPGKTLTLDSDLADAEYSLSIVLATARRMEQPHFKQLALCRLTCAVAPRNLRRR